MTEPHPLHRWPPVTREHAARSRAHSRGGPLAALSRGSDETAGWLGVAPRLSLRGPPREEPLPQLGPLVAVALAHPHGARAALLVDAAIASVLVDRTLGGEGYGLEGVVGPLRELEQGVLLYAVARWLAGSGWTAAGVLTSPAILAELLGPPPHVASPLELTLGDARGAASVWHRALDLSADLPRRLPAWAGSLPVEVTVRARSLPLSARALAELMPGDVIVPDGLGLRRVGARLAGDVWLHASGATHAWKAELNDGGLRIGGERETITVAPTRSGHIEAKEASVDDPDRILETLGDTPVTLSVELARFSLPLGELAALSPGEVVRTGAPVGERVHLCAGDRVLAVGELVEVEGEIGVRVLEVGR